MTIVFCHFSQPNVKCSIDKLSILSIYAWGGVKVNGSLEVKKERCERDKFPDFLWQKIIFIPFSNQGPWVNREVLFIEVSLECYPEDIFSSCKVWQLQRWEKTDYIKNCHSSTKQKFGGIKTLGLVGLHMSYFLGQFFYVLGSKKNIKIFLKIL